MDPLEDLLVSLGLTPRMPGQANQSPYTPYDTSQPPPAAPSVGPSGMPMAAPAVNAGVTSATPGLPAKLQAVLQQEEQGGVGGQLGGQPLMPPGGAPPVMPGGGGGFTPQPRPALPPQLQEAAQFAGFRDRYAPAPPAQDPIAALMGPPPSGPGFPPEVPPSRALAPTWMGGGQVPGVGEGPLTESEKVLLRQHPAYGRTISRLRNLDRLRAQRGML